MTKSSDERRQALSIRLRRMQDDIERLSALGQSPDTAAAVANLTSESSKLEAHIAQLPAAVGDRKKEARALRYKGMSLDEIAEKMGISKTAVRRHCGDVPVDRRRFAQLRLTPPEWLETAKSMLAEGKTRHVIAKELDIPLANFYRAFNRFTVKPN